MAIILNQKITPFYLHIKRFNSPNISFFINHFLRIYVCVATTVVFFDVND